MSVPRHLAAAPLALVCTLVLAGTAHAQSTTSRVSVSSTGAQANGVSDAAEVSANGRYVAFDSLATNFATNDNNDAYDVFLRDRATGVTRRLSVGPGDVEGNAASINPEISDDGRTVFFESEATNLVSGVDGGLFVADVATGAVRALGGPPSGASKPYYTTMSRDGSRYAFGASQGGVSQVFAGDVATGTVRRVSETGAGVAANGLSFDLALSGDGRWIAFTTESTNLVTPDANGFRDVIASDLETRAFERVNVPSGPPTTASNAHSSSPALSGDGCVIAFRSDATNLFKLPAGSTGTPLYVRDRCTQTTSVVSVDNGDVAGEGQTPSVSVDGCLVAYRGNRVSPAPSGLAALLRDRCAGVTTRLDVTTNGEPGSGAVDELQLSGTGRYALISTPNSLAGPDDSNGFQDVYLRDRGTNTKPVAELALAVNGRTVSADAQASRDADGPTLSGTIAWGDGSADASGLTASHTYARGGSFAVTVTVTDSDGASSTKTVAVTLPDPVIVQPPGGGPGTTPPPSTAKPKLSAVGLSARSFKVAAKGKAPGKGRGTILRVTLDQAATVRVRIDRAAKGRRKGKRCVAGRRTGKRCTRYTAAGSLRRKLAAGTRTIAITGRFGKKTLKPGAYRLRVDASGAGGRSAAKTLSFTVTK